MSLNAEQQRLFDIVVRERHSVYFGGDAGTGKTHVTQAMIDAMRDADLQVVVCAPTGQAAQHLDGTTIHTLFGLVPPRDPNTPCMLSRVWALEPALRGADVIVIDELSMVSQQLFEDMNRRMERIKPRAGRPMGGVQIVGLGDFCQLPPVGERSTPSGRFCFHSSNFHTLFGAHMYRLTQQMRQADDVPFAQLLARIRVCDGALAPEDVALLRSRMFVPGPVPFVDEPYLYPRRQDVDRHNGICAERLGPMVVAYAWTAKDWTATDECKRSLATMRLEERLELRVGAPVLLRFNLDLPARLVNGARGVVRAIATLCELGVRRCGRCELCRGDAPRPEHKFEKFIGAEPTDAATPVPLVEMRWGDATAVYAIGMHCQQKLWPLRGSRKRAAGADAPSGAVMCTRTQIPLSLAWGFTMHKSQGMTLPTVCVSLDRIFEDGQVYVALSRARRLTDVRIIGNYIPVKRIRAAADAVEFERLHMRPLLQ